MLEFRKMHHDTVWHWSPACTGWPGGNFQRMFGEQFPEGNRCPECGSIKRTRR